MRPICFLLSSLKTLNDLVQLVLQPVWRAFIWDVIDDSQFGCHKIISIGDAFEKVLESITKPKRSSKHICLVTLYSKIVFNNNRSTDVLRLLIKYGNDSDLLSLICFFLQARSVVLNAENGFLGNPGKSSRIVTLALICRPSNAFQIDPGYTLNFYHEVFLFSEIFATH